MQNKVLRQADEVVKIIHIQTVTCISSIIEADFRILQAYKMLSYAKHGELLLGEFFGYFVLFGWLVWF